VGSAATGETYRAPRRAHRPTPASVTGDAPAPTSALRLAKPGPTGERTCTMPQSSPAATPAPEGVAATPAQPAQATPAPAAPAQSAEFLRARRSALGNELESVTERRGEVAEQLHDPDTQAAERPGLENRLGVLDERLVQLERDIASNSEQLANAPVRASRSGTEERPRADGLLARVNPNLLTIFSFALLMPFAVNLARRMFAPDRTPRGSPPLEARTAGLQDRMDRLESAVDAVAIEVERIGEAQRFLTQAMTGQPADAPALGAGGPAFQGVTLRSRELSEPL